MSEEVKEKTVPCECLELIAFTAGTLADCSRSTRARKITYATFDCGAASAMLERVETLCGVDLSKAKEAMKKVSEALIKRNWSEAHINSLDAEAALRERLAVCE